MILLKGDKRNIDFSSPIRLNEEQKERLVNFLRDMFYHVELKESSFRTDRLGADNPFNKEWEPEEFEMLLKLDETNQEVSRTLGRTWMSIEMKRISFIPEMMTFAMNKGVDIYKTDIKKLVKDFIKEHREEILKRKEERKEENQRLKGEQVEFERLNEEIPKLEKLIGLPGFLTKEQFTEKKNRLEELKNKIAQGNDEND